MSPSDQPTPATPPGIPTPPSGAGAADLVTDSNDPRELRELLERARERLSFYESFDRIIGENIRRSGELMVETVALREQAKHQAAEMAKERATFDGTRQQDREHYRVLVQSALTEVATTKISIESVMSRLEGVLASLSEDVSDEAPAEQSLDTSAAEMTVSTTSALVERWASDPDTLPRALTPDIPDEVVATTTAANEKVAPASDVQDQSASQNGKLEEPSGPRSIEVLVQNVTEAAVALSLQKLLRSLETTTSVDPREMASGVLRLHVESTAALAESDLEGWLKEHSASLKSLSPSVIEISIGEND